MENKTMLGVIVGLAVAVIMAGSILAPVINDAVASSDTYTNDGYYTMDYVEESTTVSWVASDPYNILIDGVAYNVSHLRTAVVGCNLIISDKGLFRLSITDQSVEIRESYQNVYFAVSSSNAENSVTFTLTSSSIDATMIRDGETTTRNYTDLSGVMTINPNGNGAYTMKTGTAYVKGDSEIIFTGTTWLGGNDFGIRGVGTISDGMTISTIYRLDRTPTYSNIKVESFEVGGHVNLYMLDNITFDVDIKSTSSDERVTGNATYSYFLVPTEVTAERTVQLDSGATGVLVTIPIIVIVALILAAIAFFMRSRF